ncbi:carbohydrate kinase [Flammeovirgaceae bacterium SG7u.111]|nr:carbohydrate kinase [Flammeovirgaceae bacterium SG7u.132]WPO35000.1 carbohydrate kinase [Flammeovirgaceae bacterium SG7u.111]
MKNSLYGNIVCFGEVLWDVAPEGRTPGGAPMNVASHLQNLGTRVSLISRVGLDPLGKELENYLNGRFLDTTFLQVDPFHDTCKVQVIADDRQNVKYVFDTPCAWDFIEVTEENLQLVKEADAFVFGSLASRDEVTRQSLLAFLEVSKFNIFDVNLRSPFYEKEFIQQVLAKADLVKVNDDELSLLCSWLDFFGKEEEQLLFLQQQFSINTICLTRGEKGAWLLEDGQIYKQYGFPVEVEDTIGAGDAFLASYITKWMEQKYPYERLQFACAVGAVVSTFKGANPLIKEQDITALMNE